MSPAATTTTTTFPPCIPVVGNGVGLDAYEGTALSNVTVATFTPAGVACRYAADIAWGDGGISSGILTASGGVYSVTGTHTYADEGSYAIVVTLSAAGGTASLRTTATVLEALLFDGTRGTPAERWINELFADLLNRPADPAGLEHWGVILGGGRMAVAAGILGTAEYRTVRIQAIYQALLKRPAIASEVAPEILLLGAGSTFEQLQAMVLGSPEYFANAGGGTNDGFLTAVYRDLLGRDVDAASRAALLAQLMGGTRDQVASTVLSSQEYLHGLVNGFYQQLLHRPADPAGLSTFVQVLQAGGRDESVIGAIVSTDEYFGKTAP